MARRKVTQETIAQWVQLHRQGQSYRNIGRRFSVDPRTAKFWIQRANEDAEKEHWEAVIRQIDMKYLDNHYRMLRQLTKVVSDIAQNDPIAVHHDLSADSLLNQHIQSALESGSLDRTFRTEHPALSAEIMGRLSHKLFGSLVEHEPNLGKNVERWKEAWGWFQKLRLELIEVAENIFKFQAVAKKLAVVLKPAVLQEALGTGLLGQESCSFEIEDRSEGKVGLLWGRPGTMKGIYQGSRQEVVAVRNAYQVVLEQVFQEERMGPVEDAYRNVRRGRKELEEVTDRIILSGRPSGQCSLCFYRSVQ